MFRTSLCPSSGDRLYRTASGISLDVLAADFGVRTSRLTPDAVLYSLSPDDGHNDVRNMLS